MKRLLKIFILFIILGCLGCNINHFDAASVEYDRTFLNNTVPLPLVLHPLTEALYHDGKGVKSVLKWMHPERMTIFSENDGYYSVLEVGVNWADSSIKMAGYSRTSLYELSTQVYGTLTADNGAREILRGKIPAKIVANIKEVSGDKTTERVFTKVRPLSDKVKNDDFIILAHRGGGRNADYLPYAENSLKLFKEASFIGCKGIEIDIQFTKDLVPIIYHDGEINNRLTLKGPYQGAKIRDLNYKIIKNHVRLIDGQSIPSFQDALFTIVDSTNLRFVWLDNKSTLANMFDITIPIIQAANDYARSKNRDVLFVNGLPSDLAVENYQKVPNYKNIASLCELSLDCAADLNSLAYGQRWTQGINDAEIATAHAKNIKIIPWTVDSKSVMESYIKNGKYDGLLTNFPAILAYLYYSQE